MLCLCGGKSIMDSILTRKALLAPPQEAQRNGNPRLVSRDTGWGFSVFSARYRTPAGVINLLGACGITDQLPTQKQINLTDPPLQTQAQSHYGGTLPGMRPKWSDHWAAFLHAPDLVSCRTKTPEGEARDGDLYRISSGMP